MPVLKAASEHASFDVVPTGTFFSMAETNGGISRRYFDERYVRGALLANQTGATPSFWGLNLAAPRSSVWLHIDYSFNGPGSSSGVNGGKECFGITSPSGAMIVEVRAQPGVRAIYLSYYDPGGQVNLYGPVAVTNERVQTFDLFLDLATSTVQLYREGTLVHSTVGGISFAATQIGGMKITGRGMQGWFSQVVLADESTVGWRVAIGHSAPLFPPDVFSFPAFFEWAAHNGNNTFALSSYVTASQYDEGTFIASPNPGAKTTMQTLDPGTLPATGPQNIAAAVFYGVAQNSASSNANGWGWMLYRAGTVYNLPSFTVPKTATKTRNSAIVTTNPITGAGWSVGDFGTFDMGVIST